MVTNPARIYSPVSWGLSPSGIEATRGFEPLIRVLQILIQAASDLVNNAYGISLALCVSTWHNIYG
jgi:hypothetical protein